MRNIKICILLALQLSSLAVFAQDPDTLQAGSVLIVKDFEPTIPEAYKLKSSPKIFDTLNVKREPLKYDVLSKSLSTQFQPKPLKAAKLKGEPLEKLYNAHARFGVGLYATTYGDLLVNNLRSKKSNFGLNYHHHASNGGVNNAGYSGFNRNEVELHGKRYLYNKILSGSVFYDQHNLHRYGFSPDTVLDNTFQNDLQRDDIFQRFISYGANMRFASFIKDSNKINFDFRLKYRHVEEFYDSYEDNFKLDASLDRYLEKDFVRLNFGVDYNDYVPELLSNNLVASWQSVNVISYLNPYVQRSTPDWQIKAGLKVMAESDSVSRFNFYPDIYARYNMLRNLLIPYLGVGGGMERFGLEGVRQMNPWIISSPNTLNTNTSLRLYGGLRGQFSKRSSFNLMAEQKWVRNMPFFVNDYSNVIASQSIANQFLVVYDTVAVLNVAAEFSLEDIGRLSLFLRGDYFAYNTKNLSAPWHMPDYKLTATGVYDMKDKLVFKADLFVIGKRTAFTPFASEGEDLGYGEYGKKLPLLLDLNLGAEYRYNKRISAFLNVYNVANSKYNIWNNYPMQGITVLGGLTFSFLSR